MEQVNGKRTRVQVNFWGNLFTPQKKSRGSTQQILLYYHHWGEWSGIVCCGPRLSGPDLHWSLDQRWKRKGTPVCKKLLEKVPWTKSSRYFCSKGGFLIASRGFFALDQTFLGHPGRFFSITLHSCLKAEEGAELENEEIKFLNRKSTLLNKDRGMLSEACVSFRLQVEPLQPRVQPDTRRCRVDDHYAMRH